MYVMSATHAWSGRVNSAPFSKFGIAAVAVAAVGGNDEPLPQAAQQRLLAHDPKDALVVDGPPVLLRPALAGELGGDAPVPVAGEFQRDALNLMARSYVLFRGRGGTRALVEPGAADALGRAKAL
jgi:hypothetical protein